MNTSRTESAQVHNSDDTFRRRLTLGLVLLVSAAAFAGRLAAQTNSPFTHGTIRPIFGAYLPTGDQRDFLKDAVFAGAQGSLNITSNVAVTGAFGWAPSKDKLTPGDQKIDAFQYDAGLEVRTPDSYLGGLQPFLGAGIGGRTYSYRDLNVDSKSNFDGYGAVGVDVGRGQIGARIEARDYVSRFQPLTGGGDTKTRNDIGIFAGLAVRF